MGKGIFLTPAKTAITPALGKHEEIKAYKNL